MGFPSRVYSSAEEFLRQFEPSQPGCVIIDVRMPHTSGLSLQEHLARLPLAPPVLMMTGHAQITTALRAIRQGAIDFLEKPVNEADLYEAIQRALGTDAKRRGEHAHRAALAGKLAQLTPVEHQVLEHVVRGRANKFIASTLGVSRRTVEDRRARVMDKLEVDSLIDLIRMAIDAEIIDTNVFGPQLTVS